MSWWAGKRVLVTGGTGTIGGAVVARLLKEPVEAIRVFSRDEYKQAGMQRLYKDDRLRFLLGDVRDLGRVRRAFHHVDVIVHAAALKRVEIIEINPLEAVHTNILGTENVITAAIDSGVGQALLVSTDKVFAPASVYGATKLVAEQIWLRPYSGLEGPCFSALRLGNVWDSRGALVEILREQAPTGEVTVTDERCTRFWLNSEEAAELVVSTIANETRGLVVPMLPRVRVIDVVSAVAPRAVKRLIGLRPGEKITERLTEAAASDQGPFLSVADIRRATAL